MALAPIAVLAVWCGIATYWGQLRSERIAVPRRPRVRAGGRNPHLDGVARSLVKRLILPGLGGDSPRPCARIFARIYGVGIRS